MKPWAEHFYKSKAWIQCRLAFLQSKFFICERCEGSANIAHHKIYLTPENIHDPYITLDWSNLEALCDTCHNREHHSTDATREGLRFDSEGNLVEC